VFWKEGYKFLAVRLTKKEREYPGFLSFYKNNAGKNLNRKGVI
jgi:hypothetical protein